MPERFENDKDSYEPFPKSRALLDAFRKAEKLTAANSTQQERVQAWQEVGQLEREEFNNGEEELQF